MTQIAQINTQLQGMSSTDPTAATLMDQRDQAIDQLSQLMDIRVSTTGNNQTSIYTVEWRRTGRERRPRRSLSIRRER